MKLLVLKCSWTDCKSTRTLAVPPSFTLEQLHCVLQDAFGWEQEHLYGFHDSLGRRWRADMADDLFGDEEEASKTTVDGIAKILRNGLKDEIYDECTEWLEIETPEEAEEWLRDQVANPVEINKTLAARFAPRRRKP